MAKLDIDFILMDESVVMNGFRCLMSGYVPDGFAANPVMLCQHFRSDAENESAIYLPIGKWYDIRVEGNKLLAKPDFDDGDTFALTVQGKVERGYMKGASIWLEPMAVSNDPSLKLPGQKLATVTKWGVLESSVVDIPNCRNALAVRQNDSIIKLSADASGRVDEYFQTLLPNVINKTMSLLKLSAQKLDMPETTTEDQLLAKIDSIMDENRQVTKLKAEKLVADQKLKDLEATQLAERNASLIDTAIASGKIVAGDKDKYMKLAAADFDTTKAIIDGMSPYKSIESEFAKNQPPADQNELADLVKLSARDLYMEGKLEKLKALSIEHYVVKHKELFGVDYKQS